MMAEKSVKVDENNVAIIRESRLVYSKDQLLAKKAHHEAKIVEIGNLLSLLNA